jgi:flavin-binding protein dodecin
MSVAKVVEISAESEDSFEDAIRKGIKTAGKTVHGIKSAWVKSQQAVVKDDKIILFRVDLKLTFVLD